MPHVLLSIQGQNRTGIVADVTHLLYSHGANLTDSSMTTLRSEFAMILLLELEQDTAAFEQDLKALEDKGLSSYFKILSDAEVARNASESIPSHTLSVIGRDQTGITYHFSDVVTQHGANITDVNTRLLDDRAPRLYAMILELRLPSDKFQALQDDIGALAQRLGVDANLHAIECVEM